MPSLIHLIYASVATQKFDNEQIKELLLQSRAANERIGVTGLLLHSDGNFFQILEGAAAEVDKLFAKIDADPRHAQVTVIFREPIRRRSFAGWTMGFASTSPQELATVHGLNDFFLGGSCFHQLDSGRAKKLLTAFSKGRWHTKPIGSTQPTEFMQTPIAPSPDPKFSFAFQPIVDVVKREVFSYEALVRGRLEEPAPAILVQIGADRRLAFDRKLRTEAIALAARLKINCHLNLNYCPHTEETLPESISMMLEAGRQNGIPIEQMVLEVTETAAIHRPALFAEVVNRYRALGLKVAIDDFGAGYSGLNLLAEFQPDQIKLDIQLVRGIERHGPRQAIVRAITLVCDDLGIDVIAEGVETEQEFHWLANEGISLFQGYLFAKPAFEAFPPVHYPGEFLQEDLSAPAFVASSLSM
jgi:EAL domain-containing protein (putative c-di-GMP-specific phosphodiesterase class I)